MNLTPGVRLSFRGGEEEEVLGNKEYREIWSLGKTVVLGILSWVEGREYLVS